MAYTVCHIVVLIGRLKILNSIRFQRYELQILKVDEKKSDLLSAIAKVKYNRLSNRVCHIFFFYVKASVCGLTFDPSLIT